MKVPRFRIGSSADFEITVLSEAHALMADVISPDLYKVSGTPPDQQIVFASGPAFRLFGIRAIELWSAARDSVAFVGAPQNPSLLTGLEWVANNVLEGARGRLAAETASLQGWLQIQDPCRVWCSGIDTEINLKVSRRDLWSLWANSQKHPFLRLQDSSARVTAWCHDSGQSLKDSDVLVVLEALTQWLTGYCEYHSTMLAELVGKLFAALNALIRERATANGNSRTVAVTPHPLGATPYFADLHGSMLAFQRYPSERISTLTPTTASVLRNIYLP